jgi:hypothetical protein
MKRLFFITVILAALYAGYWFVGSSQVETRARVALADLEERGWQVDYASLDTAGFPSRFDTTVTDLSVVSPDGRVAWEAPFVQIFALSYRPNRVIAVWPERQRVMVAGQVIDIISGGIRASAAVGLSVDLPLTEATLEGPGIVLESDLGWTSSTGPLLAAIRQAGPAPATYDVYLGSEAIVLPLVAQGLDVLRIDGRVTLDAPLDARLQAAPRLLGLTLREVRLASGEAALTLAGDLAADEQGFLAGSVTLRAENWRDVLAVLESAGLLVLDQAPFLAGALEQLAEGGDDIEIPVTFQNGQVQALGVVLLSAPRVL